MPDLNLIDEGGFEESSAPAAPPIKKKQYKSGGGGGKKVLIIFLILALLGGATYILYQRGFIKLPFKKKRPPVQVQDEPFLQEQTAQTDTGQVQTAQEKNQPDTTVALLETPSIDEKKNAPEDEQGEEAEEVDMSSTETKLSDMKGDYTVQVIAYSEKSKAVETAENLENAGYPAFVEKIPMKGGEWYTVRIGRYKTPAEAEKAVKNFADELKEHYVIDKIRKK